jgi:hypothetical protein
MPFRAIVESKGAGMTQGIRFQVRLMFKLGAFANGCPFKSPVKRATPSRNTAFILKSD